MVRWEILGVQKTLVLTGLREHKTQLFQKYYHQLRVLLSCSKTWLKGFQVVRLIITDKWLCACYVIDGTLIGVSLFKYSLSEHKEHKVVPSSA